ncbi:hypothetical protein ACFY00_29885 [Kitasatospora sp. NPDC001540]|uniref:hypothetical protein n=1 Tax=Kitasatospora sp. NPDC001540 TaxID=3364014 RepID=UPI00368C14DA
MSNHRVHATRTATALAAVALAAVALAAVALAPAAHAADTPAALGSGELAAARSATQQPAVLHQLGHFFARRGVPPTQRLGISAAEEAKAATAAAPRLTGDTVPVYTLSAAFVAGRAGTPVAEVEFTATTAVAADGQRASVWTARQGGGWRVVNIASGGDEADYAARAAADGGTAFREPQIDAWYEVKGGRVLPLDEDARRSVGDRGTTVAAYQQLVHQRYGDKLPGSAYDASGKAGGFQAAAPAGADRDGGRVLAAGGAIGVTALAGAVVGARRRKARIAY